MILSLFTRAPANPGRHPARLMHPECPIEQSVRGRDAPAREALIDEAWRRRSPASATLLVGDHRGLRILAPTEPALALALGELVLRHGEGLIVEPPTVRYVQGVPVLEPWMSETVNAPHAHADKLEEDFLARRGHLRRMSPVAGRMVLEGEAPLADLLGYDDWLAELTGEEPLVATALSRYLPIDRGPRAA
jgi:hypothetical protein